jgi:SAM-dependent methyltransferase
MEIVTAPFARTASTILPMHTFSSITEQLLRTASLQEGMRVLDVGCGSGDVTRAIARWIGPTGHVVGVDGSEAALAQARATAGVEGHAPIEYVHADLADWRPGIATFDCIVGRRVLMYLRDSAAVLANLLELLRPGGKLALQEHDFTMTPGRIGSWPLHDRVQGWIRETVRREGADLHLGLSLPGMLRAAGARVDAVWAQAIFAGYERGIHYPLHEIVRAMLPRIAARGVATEPEMELGTLETRLAAERETNASSYVCDLAVCVIASRSSGQERTFRSSFRPPWSHPQYPARDTGAERLA